MFRTSLITFAVAAVALHASAATRITVNVAGLDAKAARAKITSGARTACAKETENVSIIEQPYAQSECVNDAVERAVATLAAQRAKAASEQASVAP